MNNLIIVILGGMMLVLLVMALSKPDSSENMQLKENLSVKDLEEEMKATEEFLIKYEKKQKPSFWQRMFGK